jgi:hypothetical protein
MIDQAKVKAMGAKPTATKADFAALGLDTSEVAALEKFCSANAIDWTTLWKLLQQYGPAVLAFILSLFGITPTPPVVTP